MKKKNEMMKFVQPTKRMKQALQDEGLRIVWPKGNVCEGEFCVEGTFFTGSGAENIVNIDLRDNIKSRKTANSVDKAIFEQLRDAELSFDVEEELRYHLEGGCGYRSIKEMYADFEEQASLLSRFAKVALAVVRGDEIPPEKTEEKKVEISLEKAKQIVEFLKVGCPMEEVFKRNERHSLVAYMKMVIQECE